MSSLNKFFWSDNTNAWLASGGFDCKGGILKCVSAGDAVQLNDQLDDYIAKHKQLVGNNLEFAKEAVLFGFAQISAVATSAGLDDWTANDIKREYYILMPLQTDVDSVLEMLRNFVIAFTQAVHAQKLKSCYCALVRDICGYIHMHIGDKITIADIARQFHFSESYISHRFKSDVGVSIVDYIMQIRVTQAKSLLRQQMPLVWISEQLGFCSQSHFSKVFKAQTGMTPVQYRRNLKTD